MTWPSHINMASVNYTNIKIHEKGLRLNEFDHFNQKVYIYIKNIFDNDHYSHNDVRKFGARIKYIWSDIYNISITYDFYRMRTIKFIITKKS